MRGRKSAGQTPERFVERMLGISFNVLLVDDRIRLQEFD